VGQIWGLVEFSGAALFTVFVKGAGFPSVRNTPRVKRRKDRSESAKGKGEIGDQKTRTLEHHKGAPPECSKSLKGLVSRP
jgi:hypothetical protein